MLEPEDLAQQIIDRLQQNSKPLAGYRVVVTAGPTREAIDPVRYISNHSSGKQGYAIAEALRARVRRHATNYRTNAIGHSARCPSGRHQ